MSVAAFLSHSYGAPEVNLFFHDLVATEAAISFRVDPPRAATSTTRIERMIRDSQVFIGVWSVPAPPGEKCSRDDLLRASRYFRLELDMARRARKPGIVFSDLRYGNLLKAPSNLTQVRYDAQEICHGRSSASWPGLQREVAAFFRGREAVPGPVGHESDGPVGLLLPDRYGVGARRIVSALVAQIDRDAVDIGVPFGDADSSAVGRADWVISAGGDPAFDLARAYLYGQFVPLLRLQHAGTDSGGESAEDVLYPHLDVGYRKDVVRWRTEDELEAGLRERLDVINDEARLVGTAREATEYFSMASKRKSKVFLSYSGKDAELGALFSAELKKNFQSVFDYRDGGSLAAGDYWRDQLNDSLARTAVGVILLSENYAASGHCMDEARVLYDGKVEGRVVLLPVRVDSSKVPALLATVHYARLGDGSPAGIVERFLQSSDPE